MYTGRLIFSQLMDHLPMPTFRRCVERYQGDRWVKSFSRHSPDNSQFVANSSHTPPPMEEISLCGHPTALI